MTPPDEKMALVLRAMRCKRWRAMDGMLDLRGGRIVLPPMQTFSVVIALPDFSDTQTLACLRLLVQEAWNSPAIRAAHDGGSAWRVVTPSGEFTGASEAEAMIAALEQAP
jgi:hypothetical protein